MDELSIESSQAVADFAATMKPYGGSLNWDELVASLQRAGTLATRKDTPGDQVSELSEFETLASDCDITGGLPVGSDTGEARKHVRSYLCEAADLINRQRSTMGSPRRAPPWDQTYNRDTPEDSDVIALCDLMDEGVDIWTKTFECGILVDALQKEGSAEIVIRNWSLDVATKMKDMQEKLWTQGEFRQRKVQYFKSLADLKKHTLLLGKFLGHIIVSLDSMSLPEQSAYDLKNISDRITDFIKGLTKLQNEELTALTAR
jgi:hypothetical protein